MFSKNKKLNYGARKVDKIVTTFIIGTAIASIFWLSHTKKWKEVSKEISDSINKYTPWLNAPKKAVSIFWKIIAFFVWIFSKK